MGIGRIEISNIADDQSKPSSRKKQIITPTLVTLVRSLWDNEKDISLGI